MTLTPAAEAMVQDLHDAVCKSMERHGAKLLDMTIAMYSVSGIYAAAQIDGMVYMGVPRQVARDRVLQRLTESLDEILALTPELRAAKH